MNGKGAIIREEHMTYVWMDTNACSNEDRDVIAARNEFKVDIAQFVQPFSWR